MPLPARVVWLALVLGACDSCSSCGEGKAAEAPAQPDEAKPPPAAVLEGVVRLAPGHELPAYTIEQMEAKVLDHTTRGAWPKECTPPKEADRRPVRSSDEGGLEGVALAASEFKTGRSRPPVTHEVAIEDCRLSPRLVVGVKGDTLSVKNEGGYPFMPTFGTTAMARTITSGQTQEFPLDKPGVFPLRCGFTAPCGRTDVLVMLHPLNAVSDDEGEFRIEDVPANEPFVISAWHPLFEEAKADVQVAPGETKRIELVLTPLATAAADAGSGSKPASDPPADNAAGEKSTSR